MKAYRKAIASIDHIDIKYVAEVVANSPCSRFWVSEERAHFVISSMLRGEPVLDTMRPLKREMFLDIYNIVVELRKSYPNSPLLDLVIIAVHSPTERFYMRPRCVMQVIYKIKNGFYDKRN